ncbi:MAG: hypothetical protein V4689_18065 [Verrucomicrobiota bacterium]
MLVFTLAAICIALFLVGVGIVVAVVVAASVAVLTCLGLVSSAVLVGILRRRVSSGLRTFHYLACACVALPAGVGTLWLGSWLSHSQLSPAEILTIGSVAGIGGGLALAFLFDRLASALYRRFAIPAIADSAPTR